MGEEGAAHAYDKQSAATPSTTGPLPACLPALQPKLRHSSTINSSRTDDKQQLALKLAKMEK